VRRMGETVEAISYKQTSRAAATIQGGVETHLVQHPSQPGLRARLQIGGVPRIRPDAVFPRDMRRPTRLTEPWPHHQLQNANIFGAFCSRRDLLAVDHQH
jgi:hypothetical protein